MQSENSEDVIIGSHSQGTKKPSLYVFRPKAQSASPVISTINPSYVLTRGQYIYFVTEHPKGQLVTLSKQFDPLSIVTTNGDDPIHISADESGKFMVATNYSSGSFMVFGLENGIAKQTKFFIVHEGGSSHPQRQLSPHPRSSVFSADSKILFVADLGTDVIYHYDITDNDIQVSKQKSIRLQPGSGPHTICLGHNQDNTLILSCQLDLSVRLLSFKNGPLQSLGAYKVSEDPLHALSSVCFNNGVVYMALRGADCIIILDYLQNSLKQKFRFKVGSSPRHVMINGNQIYVACEKEGSIFRYRMDGQKIFQISALNIPGASCVALFPSKPT